METLDFSTLLLEIGALRTPPSSTHHYPQPHPPHHSSHHHQQPPPTYSLQMSTPTNPAANAPAPEPKSADGPTADRGLFGGQAQKNHECHHYARMYGGQVRTLAPSALIHKHQHRRERERKLTIVSPRSRAR